MGKALVIKGADFSDNAVARVEIELPYDSEVEYLQGDGSAYVDTGIAPTQDTRFDILLSITNPTQNVGIIGTRIGLSEANMVCYYGWSNTATENSWYYRYAATYNNSTRHYKVTGDFRVNNIDSPNVLKITGDSDITVNAATGSFTCTNNLYLFTWNRGDNTPNADTLAGSTALRIKKCKLYQGTTLVRDFIPVRVGSVGYLYDKISGELFGNVAESGAFVLGPDK